MDFPPRSCINSFGDHGSLRAAAWLFRVDTKINNIAHLYINSDKALKPILGRIAI